jgi:hypothetical protein
MTSSSKVDLIQPAMSTRGEMPAEFDDTVDRQAAVSTALISVFRGKFCDLILSNRKPISFKKREVIYNVGDDERTFFSSRAAL